MYPIVSFKDTVIPRSAAMHIGPLRTLFLRSGGPAFAETCKNSRSPAQQEHTFEGAEELAAARGMTVSVEDDLLQGRTSV